MSFSGFDARCVMDVSRRSRSALQLRQTTTVRSGVRRAIAGVLGCEAGEVIQVMRLNRLRRRGLSACWHMTLCCMNVRRYPTATIDPDPTLHSASTVLLDDHVKMFA